MTESRGPVDRAVCVEFVSGYKASPCVDSHLHFCPFVRRRRSFVRSLAMRLINQIKSNQFIFRFDDWNRSGSTANGARAIDRSVVSAKMCENKHRVLPDEDMRARAGTRPGADPLGRLRVFAGDRCTFSLGVPLFTVSERRRCPRARTKTFESIDAATTGRRELDVRSSLLFAYLFPDYIFVPVDVRGGSRSLDDGPSNQSGTECISANAARIHPSIHPFIERIHRSRSPAVPRREGGQNV